MTLRDGAGVENGKEQVDREGRPQGPQQFCVRLPEPLEFPEEALSTSIFPKLGSRSTVDELSYSPGFHETNTKKEFPLQ